MSSSHLTEGGATRLADDTDLRLLSILHALLDTGSVTKAAERMGVGQPAVSRSLARLRTQLGDPLLIRVQGRMVLSPHAEKLREPLGAWLADGRTLLIPDKVIPERLVRAFRIASTDFGAISVIQPALRVIAEQAPGVEIFIQPMSSDNRRMLANGDLDLVITGRDPDLSQVHARRLFVEHHLCLARRDHPGLQQGRMSVEDFFASAHVVIRIPGGPAADYEHFYPDVRRRRLVVTDNFMLAPSLIDGPQIIMTAPSRAAVRFARLYDLALFEPPAPLPAFGYWLQWHERSERDPEVQWLIEQFASAPLSQDEPVERTN